MTVDIKMGPMTWSSTTKYTCDKCGFQTTVTEDHGKSDDYTTTEPDSGFKRMKLPLKEKPSADNVDKDSKESKMSKIYRRYYERRDIDLCSSCYKKFDAMVDKFLGEKK